MSRHELLLSEQMQDRLRAANAALRCFSKTGQIERRQAGWFVTWERSDGEKECRRWTLAADSSFYPTWQSRWRGGATSMVALAQLMRWLQERPVLPIAAWRYWHKNELFQQRPGLVPILLAAGYPSSVDCVLCGRPLGKFDWHGSNIISGPCCPRGQGCRLKTKPENKSDD